MANIIGYNIYVDGVKYNDNPLRTFRHLVTGLTNDVEYEFTVRAVDEFGNETGDSVAVFETPEGGQFDITGHTLAHTFDVGYTVQGIDFENNGSKLFAVEAGSPGKVHRYDLTLSFYISDNPPIHSSLTVGNNPIALRFNDDGSQMFLTEGSDLVEYTLSANWDITTAVEGNRMSVGVFNESIDFDLYGYKLYLRDKHRVREYNLPSPYNLSAPSLSYTTNVTLSQSDDRYFMQFTNNGDIFFIARNTDIWRLSLNIPYDLRTASDTVTEVIASRQSIGGGCFNNDGDALFLSFPNHQEIREYSL